MTETIRWEYRLESIGSFWHKPNDIELQAVLDEWGGLGWEVISLWMGGSGEKVTLVAKRPLTDRTRRERSRPS